MYLQNVFMNHIFDIYVKIGFGIIETTMVDVSENQTKPNLNDYTVNRKHSKMKGRKKNSKIQRQQEDKKMERA